MNKDADLFKAQARLTKALQEDSSPCIRHCCLDREDICLGCGRSLAQITHWNQYDKQEKQLIMQKINRTKAKRQCQ